jgi:DNA topoisomerase-1
MKLVIVESPAKAQTINKYLGNDYKVIASVGHIRDLPSKDGAVLPDENFKMSWEMNKDKDKVIKEIVGALKLADRLILATDPDREGEAISWHLKEILDNKKTTLGKPVERVVFNEITKNAVLEAMKSPRDINSELVEALRQCDSNQV